MSQREYQTIPKPLYGLSEEPLGQHAVAKVTVETQSVAIHKVKTIHSFSGTNTESPPHAWVNQVQHYVKAKSSKNPYLAQLFGYHRSGERFDLIYHGFLIPFEEQLLKLTNTQPLEKIELISKTSWKLHSACSYFINELNLSTSSPMRMFWFLLTMLHYNKEADEMMVCGDFTQWHTEGIVIRSRDTAKVRIPVLFTLSSIAKGDGKDAPSYPDFSRAGHLYGDLPREQRRLAILSFYDALTYIYIPAPLFPVPFFMRGIHVDPRIQNPCTQSWCRPMVDIWNKSARDFIQIPICHQGDVPRYHPGSPLRVGLPEELISDSPRYMQVLTSLTPHSQYIVSSATHLPDPTPLGLIPASLIWFSQAGRVFSSSQFQKSGLRKRDIMFIKTRGLNTAFMLDPSLPENIPDGLSLKLTSFRPHMDMNGIHIGPTKWSTVDPQHRSHICESSWTMRKYFYGIAEGFYWDDDTYEAIDEFHRSLGVDPCSGEMAELLGFPLLDIDDLLHTAGWTCSHPTIQDSMVKHTLTCQDIGISWDLPICSPSLMVKDATSEINIKMKEYSEEDRRFHRNDLHYSPPPMYAKFVGYWIIILAQFLCKYILGWSM